MSTVAPAPEDLDPRLLRLYQVIGYFITRWSLVEELLYVIYFRASKLPEYQCAEDFFSVDSYNLRTKFTIFAALARFPGDNVKQRYWESKIKSLNEFFKFRNFLAHNPVHEQDA